METDRGTRGWWASGLKGRWKGEWQGVQGSWRDGKRRRLPSSLKAICSGPSCHYEFLLTLAKMMQNPTPRRTQVIFFFIHSQLQFSSNPSSPQQSLIQKSQWIQRPQESTPPHSGSTSNTDTQSPGGHLPSTFSYLDPRAQLCLLTLIFFYGGRRIKLY